MDTQLPKALIESPLYVKSRNKITTNTKLLDEILEGVTFSIASKPDAFPLVDNFGTRTAKTEDTPDLSGLSVFFKEFEDHIVLLDIQLTEEEITF